MSRDPITSCDMSRDR